MPTQPSGQAPRFTFVDALRGLAALWVVGYHFYPGVSDNYRSNPFVEPFPTLMHYGECGVDVFFVLSGFVIAFTIRDAAITPGYFGNFVLRRSVRLEPPYWVTIVLTVAAVQVANLVRDDRYIPFPGWEQLLAHIFYLQEILRLGQILAVFWTLCYEVQFYLAFVLLCGLAQYLAERWRPGDVGRMRLRLMVFVPLTAWSLAARAFGLKVPHGVAVGAWSLFFLGALAWWALRREITAASFWAYFTVLLAITAWHSSVHGAVALATGMSLYVAGRMDGLGTWLGHGAFQYLGRISYSLYLIHTVIGGPFVYYFRQRLLGPEVSAPAAVGLMALACAVSIAGAQVMYWFVEKPSVEFAKWLKRKEKLENKAGPADDPADAVPQAREQ